MSMNVGSMVLALLSRIRLYSFAIQNTLVNWIRSNERITTVRLQVKKGTATFVSIYAHTLYADKQVKTVFYSKLNLVNYPNMTIL